MKDIFSGSIGIRIVAQKEPQIREVFMITRFGLCIYMAFWPIQKGLLSKTTMGTFEDAVIDALKHTVTYKSFFRFIATLGKGMVIGESFIPITFISVLAGSKNVYVHSTDDESIMIALAVARKNKVMTIGLTAFESTRKAVHHLFDLKLMSETFFSSVSIQRNVGGKRAELYVLRDDATKLIDLKTINSPERVVGYDLTLGFTSPKLLHGTGEGFNLTNV